MKVYRFNPWYNAEGIYHGIKKSEWRKGQYKLLALFLDSYCGKEYSVQPRDKYETYDKDKHRKMMCQDCVKVIKKLIAEKRKGV